VFTEQWIKQNRCHKDEICVYRRNQLSKSNTCLTVFFVWIIKSGIQIQQSNSVSRSDACAQHWLCLWIVCYWLTFRFSLMFIWYLCTHDSGLFKVCLIFWFRSFHDSVYLWFRFIDDSEFTSWSRFKRWKRRTFCVVYVTQSVVKW